MNLINFFKRWKEGILNLSPAQQLHARLVGIIGGIIGLILALISMIYNRMWGFSIFVFFIIWIQVISFIGTRQQYIQTKKMMEELNEKEMEN